MDRDDLKRMLDDVPPDLQEKAAKEGGVVVMDEDGEWLHLPKGEHPMEVQMTRLGHGMIALARCEMILKLVEGSSRFAFALTGAAALVMVATLAHMGHAMWGEFYPRSMQDLLSHYLSAYAGFAILLGAAHLILKATDREAAEANRIANEFIEFTEQSKVDEGEVTLQ